jgi:uncharacterized protein YcbX
MSADGALVRVAALWRYPIKSMAGEPLESSDIGFEGLAGDRRFAIFDTETGFGVTARRHPQMLFAIGHLQADGSAEITLPDGRISEGDADLSDWLQRPVTLRRADEPGERRFESPKDFEHEETSDWRFFNGSTGAFHDLGSANLSLISAASLVNWDPLRFRPNVLLEMDDVEDVLVGRAFRLGSAQAFIRRRLGRCVVTTRPQPGGVQRDLDVLRTINRERGGALAVGATVTQTGSVAVGDVLLEVVGATPPD